MANILILGGGFGGVAAAESLAQTLGPEHQITLYLHKRFSDDDRIIAGLRRFTGEAELARQSTGRSARA